MHDVSAAASGAWIIPAQERGSVRRNLGLGIILLTTAALIGSTIYQILYTAEKVDSGFTNWRPILYIYLLWSVGLCVGVVLVKGERGRRALFLLPALLFTISMVIFPTVFGVYIAFTNWNLSSLQGRMLWKFIQGARVELNKVVWPTREETMQTTLVVLVVALFGGVFFWLLDLFLLWLTTRITGQGSF